MKTQVWQLPYYTRAVKESHLDELHQKSCLKAELADVKGDQVYFRNYADTNLEYMEFCFTRVGVGNIKFNYISYIEWHEDME